MISPLRKLLALGAASASGHAWTLRPHLGLRLRPPPLPPSELWATRVTDARLGTVVLTGKLLRPAGSRRLLVLLHGLGGSSESVYLRPLCGAAHARGWATLRPNARGADLSGQDLYHAGMWQDLNEALGTPELARYEHVVLVGFSLGGHIALRYATERHDPRLRAVLALSAPLDLKASAESFEGALRLYQNYILGNLKAMYRPVHDRWAELGLPALPLKHAARIRSLIEWDERIVAPRHGFTGAHDYYQSESVAPQLGKIQIPATIITAEHDPMVHFSSVAGPLQAASHSTEVRTLARGGHLGFHPHVDLGLGSANTTPMTEQLLDFAERACQESAPTGPNRG